MQWQLRSELQDHKNWREFCLGGQVGIGGHITIGKNSQIGARQVL